MMQADAVAVVELFKQFVSQSSNMAIPVVSVYKEAVIYYSKSLRKAAMSTLVQQIKQSRATTW